jgi:cytochrome P450
MDTVASTAKCAFSDSLSFPFMRDRSHPLDPPPEFGIFRRERPVSQVTLWDGSKVWLVTRYNDAQQVLSDVRFSSVPSQPGYPLISPAVVATKRGDPSFLRMDPPTHTEHRRMWTPFFAVKRIQEMRPRIQRIIDSAIDEMLAKDPPGDLVQDFGLVVPSLVICELLDVPYSEHEFFQRHSKTIFAINATAEQVAEARAAISEFWRQMIDAREKNPGNDLVSQVIINEIGNGRLTKTELVAMVSLMLAAGHETTANMIALGTVTLLQHPDQLNAIKANPALTPAAVEELLRYLTVAQNGLGRAATEDIEVGGQFIRKGDGVLVLLAAANRDEAVFENSEALDIQRTPHRHMSFGAAIHQCIGSPLARAELQMAFDTLFKRVPTLHLAVAPEAIKYKFDSLFFGVHSLPVSW